MAKSHRKGFQPDAAEARLRARLEDESKQPDADTALRAQIEFWTRLHAILAANESSYGLEALDNLALALMDEDNGGQAVLEAVVSILPSPVLMHTGQVQASEIFQLPTAHTRSSKRNNSRTPPKASTAKKQRTFKNARTVIPYSFDLPEDVEDQIHQDLDRLITEAAKKDKTPPRVAYPWKGQRVWYDPAMYPLLHQKCWLFWMRFRYVVLLLALYPPTNNAVARRKLKASALPTRLQLLSAFIEKLSVVGDASPSSSYFRKADVVLNSWLDANESIPEWPSLRNLVEEFGLDEESEERNDPTDETYHDEAERDVTQKTQTTYSHASTGSSPSSSDANDGVQVSTRKQLATVETPDHGVVSWRRRGILTQYHPRTHDMERQTPGFPEYATQKMEIFRLARRWVPLETEYRTMLDARPWVDLWNKRIKFFYFHRLSKLTSKEIVVLDEYLEYVRDHVQAHCEPRHRLTMK
ncbi:hypothetical protein PI124_g4317 [Phytophthora idaei]|nr:hypothetical protein PI124_g4317 [Phytophthora idaei]